MKETIKDLLSRRSCRSFKKEQITEEELYTILSAGIYAPSGLGKQSPRIVVMQDPDDIAALSKMNAAIMGADIDPFYSAPTILIVLADPSVPTYVEDGSLVIGNMLNAASAIGVGSCWIHRAKQEFESPEGKALLAKWGLPQDLVGIGHCILGYRDGEKQEPAPRKEDYVVRA